MSLPTDKPKRAARVRLFNVLNRAAIRPDVLERFLPRIVGVEVRMWFRWDAEAVGIAPPPYASESNFHLQEVYIGGTRLDNWRAVDPPLTLDYDRREMHVATYSGALRLGALVQITRNKASLGNPLYYEPPYIAQLQALPCYQVTATYSNGQRAIVAQRSADYPVRFDLTDLTDKNAHQIGLPADWLEPRWI